MLTGPYLERRNDVFLHYLILCCSYSRSVFNLYFHSFYTLCILPVLFSLLVHLLEIMAFANSGSELWQDSWRCNLSLSLSLSLSCGTCQPSIQLRVKIHFGSS
jgi:hypothetical protein